MTTSVLCNVYVYVDQNIGFKDHELVHGSEYKLHYSIEKGNGKMKDFSDKGMRMLLVNGERVSNNHQAL